MTVFSLTLQQMLMMALLIALGYALSKSGVLPKGASVVLSRLETYVFVPALNLITQINNCDPKTFAENSRLIIYGTLCIILAMALAYPLSRAFVRKANGDSVLEYKRNIYKYAMTFGNYGFMGNFIILGIFGDGMLFKYYMFTFAFAILCNTWGLYILIPKGEGGLWQNLRKGLLTPPIIALLLGVICGLLGIKQYFPGFALSALDNASKCMGPVAMVLAGVVIGGYNFKELLCDKKVYIATFLRLVAIPAVFMVVLRLLGASEEIMTLALIGLATPLGLNTIVFPAAYGGETKTGASMAMISHAFSVITIPLMYYVFIVLL